MTGLPRGLLIRVPPGWDTDPERIQELQVLLDTHGVRFILQQGTDQLRRPIWAYSGDWERTLRWRLRGTLDERIKEACFTLTWLGTG